MNQSSFLQATDAFLEEVSTLYILWKLRKVNWKVNQDLMNIHSNDSSL